MPDKPDVQPLIDHLCHSGGLTAAQAQRVIDEVIAYFSETPENYVRRRHQEIKQETGLANAQIFARIEAEMAQLVFAAPALTQRQIRRIIYG
jgi:polyhydroxyalkanoate synthesis regulator phasin